MSEETDDYGDYGDLTLDDLDPSLKEITPKEAVELLGGKAAAAAANIGKALNNFTEPLGNSTD